MTDNLRHFTAPGRNASGKFTTGNPGRPKGAKGRQSRQILERVKEMGDDALQALHEAVETKEKWAVEFVLSKILPTNSRMIEFEDVTPEDVSEALKNGDVTAVEAKDIATALAKLAELSELAEIKQRLERLERTADEKS